MEMVGEPSWSTVTAVERTSRQQVTLAVMVGDEEVELRK